MVYNHFMKLIINATICFSPLVKLIKSHNITVEVKAASALEALCNNNHNSQERFLELDAPKAVMKLLKVFKYNAFR